MRSRVVVSACACALVALALAPGTSVAAQSGGGCQLQGSASISPGLNSTDQPFTYSFAGALSGCQSSEAGAPASGTVEAGKIITDPATGEQFQEPISSGKGSCGSSTTSGTAIVNWADGTKTVVSYTTTGALAAVHLTGTVVPSVTANAINPAPGQPTSTTITTTRYAGQSSLGELVFQPPDPTACAGAGVSTAGISGFIGLGSAS
jgi:hypothetical protein